MKAAIYARVSTDDKGQEPETQLIPCRELCQARGFEIYKEYIDVGESGRDESRPAFDKMKADALHRHFDHLIVWRMDRLSRAGISHVFRTLDYLKGCGVRVVSAQEPFLSTDSDFSPVILAVLAWAAEWEVKEMSKRVKAGVSRAEAWGKIIGKHPRDCGCGALGHSGLRKPIRNVHNKVIGWDPPLLRNRRRAAKTPLAEPSIPLYKEEPQAKPGVLAGPPEGSNGQ